MKLLAARSTQSVDPQLYRSYIVLHLVGPLFGLPICAALLALERGSGAVAFIFTGGVCLFWSLLLVARANLERAAFFSIQLLTLISLFGGFFYGGLNSPFAVWLVVAVLLGFLYLPQGVIMWGSGMLVQGALFVAAHHSWPQSTRLEAPALGALFLASAFVAALYVSLIAAFYSRIKSESSKLASISLRYEKSARRVRTTIVQLECEDRQTSGFMAEASHKLRTALDVVIGYGELLAEDAASEDCAADQRRLLRIKDSSRKLLALVADGDRWAQAAPDDTRAADTKDGAIPAPATATVPASSRRPAARRWVDPRWLAIGLVIAAGISPIMIFGVDVPMVWQAVSLMLVSIVALQFSRTRSLGDGADALTGLPDRAAFWAELERRLAGSSRSETALLFADLDGFKEVNDSLGHDVGDQLLAEVSKRFSQVCPRRIVLARLGGDEFGAVAYGAGAEVAIRNLAEGMIEALVEPIRTDEHHLTVGVSIGIAYGQAGQVSAKELLRRSDVAMYRAKHDKRVPFQAFAAEMDEALNFRRTMRQDLALALSDNDLDLHLQPVVDARSGELVSVEALLRWSHPVLGPVSPAKLIPLAEASGQIIAIDDWVLERALIYAKRFEALPIAINISPVQFRHPNFVRKIVGRLEAHAVPAQLLRLEITEGVLVTHTRAAERAIAELREAGVKVALDDFGTGYSSLSYLRDFGFDLLKVDRSFITALDKGREGAELLRAIVDLGHSLSMSVVAEGVETAEQAALVQLLGCDFIQGFFTGKPMSVHQLETWLSLRHDEDVSRASTGSSHLRDLAGGSTHY